jgi:hypothetical protein
VTSRQADKRLTLGKDGQAAARRRIPRHRNVTAILLVSVLDGHGRQDIRRPPAAEPSHLGRRIPQQGARDAGSLEVRQPTRSVRINLGLRYWQPWNETSCQPDY